MFMIEVEKQFILTPTEKSRLLEGAIFISHQENKDTYYDTAEFALTTKDIWLRERNGRFELKIAAHKPGTHGQGLPLSYTEIEDEEGIYTHLQIAKKKTLQEDLESHGYHPYADWIVTRAMYKHGEFTIEMDSTNFGYDMAEIELMVESQAQIPSAIHKIMAFAQEKELANRPVRGKNSEYLYRHDKNHFEALVKAGVIPSEQE